MVGVSIAAAASIASIASCSDGSPPRCNHLFRPWRTLSSLVDRVDVRWPAFFEALGHIGNAVSGDACCTADCPYS